MRTMTRPFLLILLLQVSAPAWTALNGAELYSQNCSACHGSSGTRGVGVPLALPEFLEAVSDEYLLKSIRYGRPGRVMPAFPYFSDAQLAAIVAHIRSFGPAHKPHSTSVAGGDPDRGGRLYARYCAACHGANGEGGKGTGVTFSRPQGLPIIAPALNNTGFLAAASSAMIKHSLIRERANTPMPSFIKQGLSESDIDDIVVYIRSFRPQHSVNEAAKEPPTLVYESKESFEDAVESVKNAIMNANFRLIRVQALDQGFVEKGQEDARRTIVYFCNFKQLDTALAIDPRVGLFLPCRITVTEHNGKVKLLSINPNRLSAVFNNEQLDEICKELTKTYRKILEDSTL